MYKFVFYVPTAYVEKVKKAVFDAGAGRIGNYESCCWQVAGQGQFRPLTGSTPFLGEVDQMMHVDEVRVETVCDDELVQAIVVALRQAHPYEEPAFDVWHLASIT